MKWLAGWLALWVGVAAAAADGVDPAVYATATPPAFRASLVGPVWDKQFAEAMAKFGDLEAVAKSALPDSGVRITGVKKGSQGAKLGLKRGDVIVSLDGEAVTAARFNDLRIEWPQKMAVVDVDGKAREVTIKPGLLEISFISLIWPQRIYVRGKTHDKKWDNFAFIGAATCESDPDLAETAWQHAISDYCGTQIAWRQGRNDDAVAFCARLCGRADAPAALDVPRLARLIAVANFKIEQALAEKIAPPPLAPMLSGDEGDWLGKLRDMHQQLPLVQRTAPSPMEIFGRGQKGFLSKVTLVPIGDRAFDKGARRELIILRQGKLAQWDAPIDRHFYFIARATADDPDAELVFKGKIKEHGPRMGDVAKCLIMRLVDCDAGEQAMLDDDDQNNVLGVMLEPSGVCSVLQGHDPETLVQSVEIRSEVMDFKQFTVRLLHAGGRDEVWINNRRLLYLPAMTTPKKIGIAFDTWGADSEFRADLVVPEAAQN